MDAIQKLSAWIDSEKANYQRNKETMTPDAKLEAIEWQLHLIEFKTQIKRCKDEETQEFLDSNFPVTPRKTFKERLCEEIKHQSKEKANGL